MIKPLMNQLSNYLVICCSQRLLHELMHVGCASWSAGGCVVERAVGGGWERRQTGGGQAGDGWVGGRVAGWPGGRVRGEAGGRVGNNIPVVQRDILLSKPDIFRKYTFCASIECINYASNAFSLLLHELQIRLAFDVVIQAIIVTSIIN